MANQIIVVDIKNDRRWDEYVDDHPSGTVYHSTAWGQVLESTFRYTPFYLALEREDKRRFEGIVPLFLIDNRLAGKKVVSLPLTTYCKRLMPDTDFDRMLHFIKSHVSGNVCMEFKLFEEGECRFDMLERRSDYVTQVLQIEPDLEKTYRKFHDTSIRQKIKRAEKSGLNLRMGESEKDLRSFYKLYTKTRKKHGLPPQPFSFFLNMWRVLKPKNLMSLPLVEHEDKVVAAATILKSKNIHHFEYSGSDERSLKLFPNHKLIWESIQLAYRTGSRFFDFGRSWNSNKPLIDFKARWGAEKYELPYYYYPKDQKFRLKDSSVPETLRHINRILPDFLLEIEGNIVYQIIK